MESSFFFTAAIVVAVAAAMLFIEKRPPSQVGMVVAFMLLTWVVYVVLFRGIPHTS
jgi:divalent metal cation (Fe/Co/Zn/Cd) transporter